ncbi:MAG: hypothetical protein ABWX63_04160 [Paeniglutamicibacter terrestris]|uniref:Uncharacterized protein n=1 Tax=Paeniglutamicibacter terrestris TaxID=2723403 RepID=A0ABX1G5G1_9MICC|nr:hypothetical protein [Paeniglutamicibacter terrestris]ASN40175.1 hypothetical protein CGQ24_14980 [Arthrobacter sp. 7749]NKG21492.1 hypothetical protein [Paeniglutamicibacter terrestris]
MNNTQRVNGAQFAWIGFAMGIACMVGLFIYGLISSTAGLLVMSSSVAAMLGALWVSTSVAARKRAQK